MRVSATVRLTVIPNTATTLVLNATNLETVMLRQKRLLSGKAGTTIDTLYSQGRHK